MFFKYIVIFCVVSSIFSIQIKDKELKQGCFMAYKECYFKGWHWKAYCHDVSNIMDYYIYQPGGVKSIRLGPNTKINIFTDEDYKGEKADISESINCLDTSNDENLKAFKEKKIYSVKILKSTNE
jgi:hypothetical protein